VGSYYRLRLFVIAIESGERKSSTAVNIIKPNEQIAYLSGSTQNIEGYDFDCKAIVSILPFVGEEKAAVAFNQAVHRAVTDLQKYSPRAVSAAAVQASGVSIPTNMPPIRKLTPGARFALTGGIYPGYANEYYLQLWLWDMADILRTTWCLRILTKG
jgi:hypothetical protein